MNKKFVKVILVGIAKRIFINLDLVLLRALKRKIELLKQDPEYGIHIPKNLIPKKYLIDYDVTNLWKVNLPNGWRFIYSLKGSEHEILVLILEIFNHKTYEKRFKYKTR